MIRGLLLCALAVAVALAIPTYPSKFTKFPDVGSNAGAYGTGGMLYDGSWIYALTYQGVFAMDPKTGNTMWNRTTGVFASPNSLQWFDPATKTKILFCNDLSFGIVNTSGGLMWSKTLTSISICPVVFGTQVIAYDYYNDLILNVNGMTGVQAGQVSASSFSAFIPYMAGTMQGLAYSSYYSTYWLNISATSIGKSATSLPTPVQTTWMSAGMVCNSGSYTITCYETMNWTSMAFSINAISSTSLQDYYWYQNSTGMWNLFYLAGDNYGIFSVGQGTPYWTFAAASSSTSYSSAFFTPRSAYIVDGDRSFRLDFANPSQMVWIVGEYVNSPNSDDFYGYDVHSYSGCMSLDGMHWSVISSTYLGAAVVNPWTGNPRGFLRNDNVEGSIATCFYEPNLYNGSYIVEITNGGSSNYIGVFLNSSMIFNVTVAPTNEQFSSNGYGIVSTPFSFWGSAAFFGASNYLCRVDMNNGSLAWCMAPSGVSSSNTVEQMPTLDASRMRVMTVADNYFYAYSVWGVNLITATSGAIDLSTVCTSSQTSNAASMLYVDGLTGSVYLTYNGCIIKIDSSYTATAVQGTSSMAYGGAPVGSTLRIFVLACTSFGSTCGYSGSSSNANMVASFFKAGLTSDTTFDPSTSSSSSYDYFFQPAYLPESDDIYAGSYFGNLYCLTTSTLHQSWKYEGSSANELNGMPFSLGTQNVYTLDSDGTLYAFQQGAFLSLSGAPKKVFDPVPGPASYSGGGLGGRSVTASPDGWIVAGSYGGLSATFALNGTQLWNNTGIYALSASVYWGVIYSLDSYSSASIKLRDLYSGKLWLSIGDNSVNTLSTNMSATVFAKGSDSDAGGEVNFVSIDPRLYTTLPPPLNGGGSNSALAFIKANLTWIAGVVVGLAVIVVVVVLVKKFTGGAASAASGSTDYQQMSGSKNAV